MLHYFTATYGGTRSEIADVLRDIATDLESDGDDNPYGGIKGASHCGPEACGDWNIVPLTLEDIVPPSLRLRVEELEINP